MLPIYIKPMLAKTAIEPFDSPDFTYEIKWDGYRCLAFTSSKTQLQSRNLKDISAVFPELNNIHQRLNKPNCILDGEIIAFRDNRPSFLELQKRAQLRNEQQIKTAMKSVPVVYVTFDLIYWNDQSMIHEPIEKRRSLLTETLTPTDDLIVTQFIENSGISYFKAITQLNMEGVMAKQKGSFYLPGKRVGSWLKLKHKKMGNFVVCGYLINPTSRGFLSSLILGAYFSNEFKFFGMVGTGFSTNELRVIENELSKIVTSNCPFNDIPINSEKVHWTKPLVVCEVEYLELTDEGSLRHPSFKKFRPDLHPEDCIFEN